MGIYRHHVLPRLVDRACSMPELRRYREEAVRGLRGRVLEIGFGSGLNVPIYPAEVDEVLAVEPALTARSLAADRIAASPVRVEHIGLDGQSLPLDDNSVDSALSTFTLCTIPDVVRALEEVRRVLRPGGTLHLLEHGRSPDADVARWQRRLEPVQKLVADGCHLTRDPIALVTATGFEIEWVDQRQARGPAPWTYMTLAAARRI